MAYDQPPGIHPMGFGPPSGAVMPPTTHDYMSHAPSQPAAVGFGGDVHFPDMYGIHPSGDPGPGSDPALHMGGVAPHYYVQQPAPNMQGHHMYPPAPHHHHGPRGGGGGMGGGYGNARGGRGRGRGKGELAGARRLGGGRLAFNPRPLLPVSAGRGGGGGRGGAGGEHHGGGQRGGFDRSPQRRPERGRGRGSMHSLGSGSNGGGHDSGDSRETGSHNHHHRQQQRFSTQHYGEADSSNSSAWDAVDQGPALGDRDLLITDDSSEGGKLTPRHPATQCGLETKTFPNQ